MRPLDNPYIDRMARAYRTMHGNKAVDKDFARGLISALRKGETVGVLMDTNMIASQGVFVDFFGIQPAPPAARPALPSKPMPRSSPASPSGTPCCRNIACASIPRWN